MLDGFCRTVNGAVICAFGGIGAQTFLPAIRLARSKNEFNIVY